MRDPYAGGLEPNMKDANMTGVRVTNLADHSQEKTYFTSLRLAVISAHAQSLGDWNTWDYEAKYGHLVVEGQHSIACGNWGALKSGR